MLEQRIVNAARTALGRIDFDDLSPIQQARFAGGLGVNLGELRASMAGGGRSSDLAARRAAEIAELRAGGSIPRGANVSVGARGGKLTVGAGAETETALAESLVRDPAVWAAVKAAERALGQKGKGSRAERYLRVTDRLAQVRRLAIRKPERVDDDSFERLNHHRRQLRAAEDAYRERRERACAAHAGMARQLTAMRAAAHKLAAA